MASIGSLVKREGTEFFSPIDSPAWNPRGFHGTLVTSSRNFCILQIENCHARGSALKLHSLSFSGLQMKDAAAIYSRVEVSKQRVDDLKTLCQNYFSTNHLLLGGVSPGVWTLGYAIPYHTN